MSGPLNIDAAVVGPVVTMQITKDQLRDWHACSDGYKWFLQRFPEGVADYQAVLDALADENRPEDAHWLMDHAGADSSTLEVDCIADTKHLFFAGRVVIARGATLSGALRAGLGIDAGEGIKAGWGIKAGLGIKAGDSINAGQSIKAGLGIDAGQSIKAGLGIKARWGIRTGDGWACFAGLRVRVADWPVYAQVTAKFKPTHLASGCWVELA
jgi:hypothetical protein